MKIIAPNSAIFSHIPGENGTGKGSCLATRAGADVARSRIAWIYLVINQYPGESFREGKVGRNNNTKIDNSVFGVLLPSPRSSNMTGLAHLVASVHRRKRYPSGGVFSEYGIDVTPPLGNSKKLI